jgi:hypothetical protein
MEDLKEVSYCLGVQLLWDKGSISISLDQTSYIEYVLKHFGIKVLEPMNTPFDINTTFVKDVKLREDDFREWKC